MEGCFFFFTLRRFELGVCVYVQKEMNRMNDDERRNRENGEGEEQ